LGAPGRKLKGAGMDRSDVRFALYMFLFAEGLIMVIGGFIFALCVSSQSHSTAMVYAPAASLGAMGLTSLIFGLLGQAMERSRK
jgi:hypothetical protein